MTFSSTDFFLILILLVILFFYHVIFNLPTKIKNSTKKLGDLILKDLNTFSQQLQDKHHENMQEINMQKSELVSSQNSLIKLISRANEIAEYLNVANNDVMKLQQALQSFETKLSNIRDQIQHLNDLKLDVEHLQQSINETRQGQNDVDINIDNMTERLTQEKNRLNESLENEFKNMSTQFDTHKESFIKLQSELQFQREKLNNTADEIGYMATALDNSKADMNKQIDTFAQDVKTELELNNLQVLEKNHLNIEKKLQETEAILLQKWAGLMEAPIKLDEWQDEWQQLLLQKSGTIEDAMKSQQDLLDQLQEHIAAAKTQLFTQLEEEIQQEFIQAQHKSTDKWQQYKKQMSEEWALLKTDLGEVKESIDLNISEHQDYMTAELQGSKTQLAEINSKLSLTEDTLHRNHEKFDDMHSQFDSYQQEIALTQQEKQKDLEAKMELAMRQLQDSWSNRYKLQFSSISDELDTQTKQFKVQYEENLTEQKNDFDQKLNDNKEALNKKIHTIINKIKKEYDIYFEGIKTKFDNMLATFNTTKDTLINKQSDLEDASRKKLKNIDSHILTIESNVSNIEKELEQKQGQLISKFQNEMRQSNDGLEQMNLRIDTIYNAQNEAYKTRMADLEKTLEEQELAVRTISRSSKELSEIAELRQNLEEETHRINEQMALMQQYRHDLSTNQDVIKPYLEKIYQIENILDDLTNREANLNQTITLINNLKADSEKLFKDEQHFKKVQSEISKQLVDHDVLNKNLQAYHKSNVEMVSNLKKADTQNALLNASLEALDAKQDNLVDMQENVERLRVRMNQLTTAYEQIANEQNSLLDAIESKDQVSLNLTQLQEILANADAYRTDLVEIENKFTQLENDIGSSLRIYTDLARNKIQSTDKVAKPTDYDKEKQILRLYKEQKWSVSEIAKNLSISEGQVELTIKRHNR